MGIGFRVSGINQPKVWVLGCGGLRFWGLGLRIKPTEPDRTRV